MGETLFGKPPEKTPWARFSMRHAPDRDALWVTINTDWDPDQSVRDVRRGAFDTMVAVLRRSRVHFVHGPPKRWVANPSIGLELITNFMQLGFTFRQEAVERFLRGVPQQVSSPSQTQWASSQPPPPPAGSHQHPPLPGGGLPQPAGQAPAGMLQPPHGSQHARAGQLPNHSQHTGQLPNHSQPPVGGQPLPGLASQPSPPAWTQASPRRSMPAAVHSVGAAPIHHQPPLQPQPHTTSSPPQPGQPEVRQGVIATQVCPDFIRRDASPRSSTTQAPEAPPPRPTVAEVPGAPSNLVTIAPASSVAAHAPTRQPPPTRPVPSPQVEPHQQAPVEVATQAEASASVESLAWRGDTVALSNGARRPSAQQPGVESVSHVGAVHDVSIVLESQDTDAATAAAVAAAAEAAAAAPPRRRLRSRVGAAAAAAAAAAPARSQQLPPGDEEGGPAAAVKRPAPAAAVETKAIDADRECKICMDAIVDIVFVPCGHMAACSSCAKQLGKRPPCPVCRKKIRMMQRVYFS